MIPKMVLPTECFTTNLAGVRSFVRVSSLVNQQIVRFGEVSLAVLADELLSGTGSAGSRGVGGGLEVMNLFGFYTVFPEFLLPNCTD